jgi:hypothetical protein
VLTNTFPCGRPPLTFWSLSAACTLHATLPSRSCLTVSTATRVLFHTPFSVTGAYIQPLAHLATFSFTEPSTSLLEQKTMLFHIVRPNDPVHIPRGSFPKALKRHGIHSSLPCALSPWHQLPLIESWMSMLVLTPAFTLSPNTMKPSKIANGLLRPQNPFACVLACPAAALPVLSLSTSAGSYPLGPARSDLLYCPIHGVTFRSRETYRKAACKPRPHVDRGGAVPARRPSLKGGILRACRSHLHAGRRHEGRQREGGEQKSVVLPLLNSRRGRV